jgi:molybdopterin molybdotransferase
MMSGFVEEARSVDDCLDFAAESLGFPWRIPSRAARVMDAIYCRSSADVTSPEPYPPFARSTRDGYAADHANTVGASAGSPVFLKLAGEISMGSAPSFKLASDETASIPTGGMLPDGADAVVMAENTSVSGDWVEIRSPAQRGENVIGAAEEIAIGDVLLRRGETIGCSTPGLLAAFGITSIDIADIRIGVISTGDEIVPAEAPRIPNGCVRDADAFLIQSILERYGLPSEAYGIAPDIWEDIRALAEKAVGECDVVLISGGSSVGARDHTARLIDEFSDPGLLVRGVNMTPGKPTLIGGSKGRGKLIVGLPGHPLSCMTVTVFIVLPLINAMCGFGERDAGKYCALPLAEDVTGRAGPDEFIPARVGTDGVRPLAAKSGYVSAMRSADGFIRLRPDTETLRKGEPAEVWLW